METLDRQVIFQLTFYIGVSAGQRDGFRIIIGKAGGRKSREEEEEEEEEVGEMR